MIRYTVLSQNSHFCCFRATGWHEIHVHNMWSWCIHYFSVSYYTKSLQVNCISNYDNFKTAFINWDLRQTEKGNQWQGNISKLQESVGFNIPLNTLQVIAEMIFQTNHLAVTIQTAWTRVTTTNICKLKLNLMKLINWDLRQTEKNNQWQGNISKLQESVGFNIPLNTLQFIAEMIFQTNHLTVTIQTA